MQQNSGVSHDLNQPTIAIGGTGGSGTRLLAQIVQALGYHIGSDLNKAQDNLLFTLLFRRKNILLEQPTQLNRLIDLFIRCLRGNAQLDKTDIDLLSGLAKGDRHNFPESWLQERLQMVTSLNTAECHSLIAWKEPNTHVFLDKLLSQLNELRYIHVVRDGLDMAFSTNQYQLMLWGDCFLNRPVSKSPSDALKYWNVVHHRVMALKQQYPDRIDILSYDRICTQRGNDLERLYDIIEKKPNSEQTALINSLIQPPDSIGRAKQQNLQSIDNETIAQYRHIMSSL